MPNADSITLVVRRCVQCTSREVVEGRKFLAVAPRLPPRQAAPWGTSPRTARPSDRRRARSPRATRPSRSRAGIASPAPGSTWAGVELRTLPDLAFCCQLPAEKELRSSLGERMRRESPYVLHRMASPRLLEIPAKAPKGFRLAAHIADEQQFSYPMQPDRIRLRALFERDASAAAKCPPRVPQPPK